MSNSTATANEVRDDGNDLGTLGELAEIKPVVLRGVHQIKKHALKESLYFRFPVVVMIKACDLVRAIEALEQMNIDSAWWYACREKIHLAPLYLETTDVSAFTDEDKQDFKNRLGMIASCLVSTKKPRIEVELLPSIPDFCSENQDGFLITKKVVLDYGHSLNYRMLTFRHDGLEMMVSYQWQNRLHGDVTKGEGLFIKTEPSNDLSIDLEGCKDSFSMALIVNSKMFGNSNSQGAMFQRILSIISELVSKAKASRRELEDAKRSRKQIHIIRDAKLDW